MLLRLHAAIYYSFFKVNTLNLAWFGTIGMQNANYRWLRVKITSSEDIIANMMLPNSTEYSIGGYISDWLCILYNSINKFAYFCTIRESYSLPKTLRRDDTQSGTSSLGEIASFCLEGIGSGALQLISGSRGKKRVTSYGSKEATCAKVTKKWHGEGRLILYRFAVL